MTGKSLLNALPNMPGMLTPPLAGSVDGPKIVELSVPVAAGTR